jgi:protein-L-isoaspartate(D-aspartate) O-methyltransferase
MKGPNAISILVSLLIPFIFLFSQETQEETYAKVRKYMVANQLAARDISDRKVLEVMEKVPRHLFVNPNYRSLAYADRPLPIDEGQTISHAPCR